MNIYRSMMICIVALGFTFELAQAQLPAPQKLDIRKSSTSGLVTFVTASNAGAISVQNPAGRAIQPMDFFNAHAQLFGIQNPATQLKFDKVDVDRLRKIHTTFLQVHKGVTVFSGVMKVHQDQAGNILAVNGDFYPLPDKLNVQPTLTLAEAQTKAKMILGDPQLHVEHSELVIVDPGWYGDRPIGPHLAYYVILNNFPVPLREAFFIDAHTGKTLDRWNLLHTSLYRVIGDDNVQAWVRYEGDPPNGDPEVDAVYDYNGDWYGFFERGFGRDGYDNFGSDMINIVNLINDSCPNAFAGGGRAFFCTGTATDDIVAHEWGHNLTEWTANLIYQNQSGQLNESYSDVWGELVDLYNGNAAFSGTPGGTPWPTHPTGPGTDTPNNLRSGCVGGVSLDVNSPPAIAATYFAREAAFGPALSEAGTSGEVASALPATACTSITNPAELNGKIALVDRGDCDFTVKVENCQAAGATAVIVANNIAGPPVALGGSSGVVAIPSLMIAQDHGALIRNELENLTMVNATLRANPSGDVRWLMGEDSAGFGGAIRDMWEPTCMGDPDRANHPFQVCNPLDGGGVHSGSGVPNHAFAILTDGKSFNGYTVNAIGPIKAGAVWYRALTVYLTPASNFEDTYVALNQAAADLVGNNVIDPRDGSIYDIFTSADAGEVDKALLATEMNTQGLCGWFNGILNPAPAVKCESRSVFYADDIEGGAGDWTVFNSGPAGPPTPYNWVVRAGGLPDARPGLVWYGEDRDIGDCGFQDESATHSLFSPVIPLPAFLQTPTLSFTHYVATEELWDGGNVKISVDGGPFTLIPGSAFLYNGYNNILLPPEAGNSNPMAGQEAWTGVELSGQWGTSLVDLSSFVSGGEDIQLRFDMGKDGCFGADGWYIDDIELYDCPDCAAVDPLLLDPYSPGSFVCVGGDNYGLACMTCNGGGRNGELCLDTGDCSGGGLCETNDTICPGSTCGGVTTVLGVNTIGWPKSRYLGVQPNPTTAGIPTAIRVKMIDINGNANCNGEVRWAGPPVEFCEGGACTTLFYGSQLQSTPHWMDWTTVGVVQLYGEEVISDSRYAVQMIRQQCEASLDNESSYSSPALIVDTAKWGDVVVPLAGFTSAAQPAISDVLKLVDKWLGNLEPRKSRAQLQPTTINPTSSVGIADVLKSVDAWLGTPYPFSITTCTP